MSFLKRLHNALPDEKGLTITGYRSGSYDPVYFPPLTRNVGQSLELYPQDNGERYISKGYILNDAVYSIVSKCAKKLGQVPFHHVKIRKNERKTWQEYLTLTKNGIGPAHLKELKHMRTKAIDENIVDSKLSRKLAKPNRYQSGSQFIEQLYGFKLLHGEGNIHINRGLDGQGQLLNKGPFLEMLIIPKPFLLIVGNNNDPWEIERFIFNVNKGERVPWDKRNVIMWKFPNYRFDALTKEHLRGQAPLEAGIVLLQAMNEGTKRTAAMNSSGGANGLLFNKGVTQMPDPAKAAEHRRQINATVNSTDMAGKIATLYGGDWQYIQFGLNADQLKLIEQYNLDFTRLCNIFDVPPGLFAKDQTYENQRESKRSFIYENIAVAAYGLRDELNSRLIEDFDLDRDTDFIDCDIMALPELSTDLKEQVTALKDAYWLSVDQKLTASGYEPIGGAEGEVRLVPTGLQSLKDAVSGVGGDLDNEMNLLNEE